MAKVIEFYVPSSFRKKVPKGVPPEHRGKVIQLGLAQRNRPHEEECQCHTEQSLCTTKIH